MIDWSFSKERRGGWTPSIAPMNSVNKESFRNKQNCWSCRLKESYRINKKQKSWRSQINIKLTRSNDDNSWKHSLKYFGQKCHIWWEINNLTSRLELIAQWAFYSLFILASMQCKICNRVFHYSLVTQLVDRSQTYTGLVSLCIWLIT